MLEPKNPNASHVTSHRLVMPDQLNPNATLFGGELMSWIDEVAYLCAERHADNSRVVTASVDRLEFLQPLRMGDHVILTARVEYVGRTSMAIEVLVEKQSSRGGARTAVAVTHLTFVALDLDGRPSCVPPLDVKTESELERYHAARVRAKVYLRYRNWRARKVARAAG